MKAFVAAALAASATALSNVEFEFIKYIAEHGKQYRTTDEYELRLTQFTRNYNAVGQHNASPSLYRQGLNKFSDWTEAEVEAFFSFQGQEDEPAINTVSVEPLANAVPIDWRTRGAV